MLAKGKMYKAKILRYFTIKESIKVSSLLIFFSIYQPIIIANTVDSAGSITIVPKLLIKMFMSICLGVVLVLVIELVFFYIDKKHENTNNY